MVSIMMQSSIGDLFRCTTNPATATALFRIPNEHAVCTTRVIAFVILPH